MSKKQQQQDQYRERERSRYENPIASREYILKKINSVASPMTKAELEKALGVKTIQEQTALSRRLKAMLRDGQLKLNSRKKYSQGAALPVCKARVVIRKNGFVGLDLLDADNMQEQIKGAVTLNQDHAKELMAGDWVLVRLAVSENAETKATLVEVTERASKYLVGMLEQTRRKLVFTPACRSYTGPMRLQPGGCKANAGAYVQVKIIKYPSSRQELVVRVEKVLGDHATAGLERQMAIEAFHLPYQFSAEALAQAKDLQNQPVVVGDRADWRKYAFITIDGEDARDFDDAVYAEQTTQGWRIYVAIADVSHYVQLGSVLDKEAKLRATSVYLPGSVIPMLPEELSNDLCSLKPKVDRLVLGVCIEVDHNAKVLSAEFHNAIIHSHARMTYTEVAKLIETDHASWPLWLQPTLGSLNHCYRLLAKRRKQRGSIEFNLPETKIVFNQDGKIDKIIPTARNCAHLLIEECMLLANEVCAAKLLESRAAAMYRVHAKPNQEKLGLLRTFLADYGMVMVSKGEIGSKDIQKIMHESAGKEHAATIQSMLLSSMAQAVYAVDNIGHFGLAYQHYSHFTSPIRRYPDLVVHRVIKSLIAKARPVYQYNELRPLAKHCSYAERRADEASRYVISWLKCEYMSKHVGQRFWGKVVGVKSFGLFIALEEIHIEGLLHMSQLANDYYSYDSSRQVLIGRSKENVYKIGQRLQVEVARVDTFARLIDFKKITTA